MKKLVFVFAALVAMSFAACCNQTEATATTNDSDTIVVVDSCNCDSCTCDSVCNCSPCSCDSCID